MRSALVYLRRVLEGKSQRATVPSQVPASRRQESGARLGAHYGQAAPTLRGAHLSVEQLSRNPVGTSHVGSA
ncbi:hypothetical protein XENOCAPTIV_022840, partial [Xenoophorus captivus]